jgi:peptidoglycan biosynthesis protein MviN/MurJ (putative lipid II flippase)
MTRVLKAVTAISLGTLLSRVLGFVRDATQAHVLGASWVNGVF